MQYSKENLFELCFNGYISIKLVKLKIDIASVSSKELLDIQVTIEFRFTLKRVLP